MYAHKPAKLVLRHAHAFADCPYLLALSLEQKPTVIVQYQFLWVYLEQFSNLYQVVNGDEIVRFFISCISSSVYAYMPCYITL